MKNDENSEGRAGRWQATIVKLQLTESAVYYYYNFIKVEEVSKADGHLVMQYHYEQKEFELAAKFQAESIPKSFTNKTIAFPEGFEIEFKNIFGSNLEEIKKSFKPT